MMSRCLLSKERIIRMIVGICDSMGAKGDEDYGDVKLKWRRSGRKTDSTRFTLEGDLKGEMFAAGGTVCASRYYDKAYGVYVKNRPSLLVWIVQTFHTEIEDEILENFRDPELLRREFDSDQDCAEFMLKHLPLEAA